MKHVFTDKKKQSDPTLPAGSISFGNVIYKNEDSLAKETKAAYQVLNDGEFLINPLNMNYDLLSLRTAL
ncbi:restriction endonuclease subunit S, partial [Planktomarina temperata]|nr:restriction endonuclease subunit S [Planktomarina temperata]